MVYTLPADLQEKARLELNETDEVKAAALKSLRAKLDAAGLPIAASGGRWQPPRTDDDFLLRFLRQKKFRVDDAFTAMKAHAEFFREHAAQFQGGNAAECREMYDMMGTMIVPERDAEGRLCTLLVRHASPFPQRVFVTSCAGARPHESESWSVARGIHDQGDEEHGVSDGVAAG